MRYTQFVTGLSLVFSIFVMAEVAVAHITPPVIIVSERDAVLGMTAGAKKYFVREVKLASEEKEQIQKQWGWRVEDPFYRFYIGRGENGEIVSAVIFMTEFTIHGPLRVAVALDPDGKVRDARIVECTEETYTWVKPLIDRHFAREYVGQDSRGSFAVTASHAMGQENMILFYNQVGTSLIQRGAVLYEMAFLKRGEK